MSETKEQLLEDIALFESIHKEEMRNVENRQGLQSQVISNKALAPAIVRYMNHKLMNQGKKNARSRKQSSNEEK